MTTCLTESENFSYMMLNLVGEVGEFASKVAKAIRKDDAGIDENDLYFTSINYKAKDLEKEAGDILWQLSGLCSVMGWTSKKSPRKISTNSPPARLVTKSTATATTDSMTISFNTTDFGGITKTK